MKKSRGAFIAVVVALSLGSVTLARSHWATDMGLDVWNLPQLKESAQEAETRMAELDEACGVVQQRLDVKDQLISDLIAERITLAQAVEAFREVNAENPRILELLKDRYNEADEQRVLVRNILEYARSKVMRGSSYSRETLTRLYREATELLGGRTPVL